MMTAMPTYKTILMLLFVVGAHVSVAQEDTRIIKFRSIAIKVWSDATTVSFVAEGDQVESIPLSEVSFSNEYQVRVGDTLNFYGSNVSTPTAAVGVPTNALLATTTLSRDSDEFLLIFLPSESEGRHSYRVHAIPSSEDDFSVGAVMFVNMSEYVMVAKMAGDVIKLPVGQPSIVSYQGNNDRYSGIVQVAVFLENSWRMFYSSEWTLSKRSKTVVMIYKNPKSGFPLLRSVSYRI